MQSPDIVKVEVKPHHLKGNSYVNREQDTSRNCPLWEALEEAGYNVTRVGVRHLDMDGEGYDICNEWDERAVIRHIERANEGSQESIFVTLHKWED